MYKKLLYPFAFLLFPLRLLAWGHAGHQMVADLAMNMLSDATRVKVERILNGMTPAEAGTWMDDVRNDLYVIQLQKPKNGRYTYTIAFAEWGGKSMGETCTVIIKGDRVTVVYNGTGHFTAKKGEILAQGILMKHKSGKWIIGHSRKDKTAKDIGGCSEGPSEIDWEKKVFWLC